MQVFSQNVVAIIHSVWVSTFSWPLYHVDVHVSFWHGLPIQWCMTNMFYLAALMGLSPENRSAI